MPRRWRCGGIRLLEILRLTIAIAIGFCFRIFLEPHVASKGGVDCTSCPSCNVNNPEEDLQTGVQPQLREPFKPRTRHDVLRFQYFNSSNIFDYFDENPKTALMGHQRSDINDILSQSLALFNSGKPKPWKMKKLVNGYRRVDPLRGEEYILDIEMQANYGNVKDSSTKDIVTEVQRLQVVKPFGVAQMLQTHLYSDNKMIHFILPVTTNVSERLERFLKNFEEICLKTREKVYLMVILFGGKSTEERTKADAVRERIQKLHERYRTSHIRVIQTYKEFNRGRGLDLGAKQLPAETLMFFCDIDVQFTADFLNRCRHNSIQGSQVYYPVVFAQYKPDIVKTFSPPKEVKSLYTISKHTGHWVHYGFGMTCLYNIDYRVIGGFGSEHQGWGGEDVDLYNKHVESNLNIFRAMEPGLIHIYHDKICDPKANQDQRRMCMGSMAMGYGSRAQLALKITSEKKVENSHPKPIPG